MPSIEPYKDTFLPERFLRWIETLRIKFRVIPTFNIGDGDPEGVVNGIEADRYYNRQGSRGTRLYVKTTNTGNTGWQHYDSSGSATLGDWTYRTAITNNPTTGRIHFNNLAVASATEVFLHKVNAGGTDASLFLNALVSGDQLFMQDQGDASSRLLITIGVPSFADPVFTFPITTIVTEGPALSQNDSVAIAKV